MLEKVTFDRKSRWRAKIAGKCTQFNDILLELSFMLEFLSNILLDCVQFTQFIVTLHRMWWAHLKAARSRFSLDLTVFAALISIQTMKLEWSPIGWMWRYYLYILFYYFLHSPWPPAKQCDDRFCYRVRASMKRSNNSNVLAEKWGNEQNKKSSANETRDK